MQAVAHISSLPPLLVLTAVVVVAAVAGLVVVRLG